MSFTIAIIGRPNVGKSTLFNRLVGQKLALVDDLPGVTRDRREGEGRLGDRRSTIIDTAGREEAAPESLYGRMRAQTETAIAQADAIFFMIDARAGAIPADRAFAEVARKSGKPVVLIANKCEGRSGEAGRMEAYSLGLGEPIGISAEHDEGMVDLNDALVAAIPETAAAEREEAAREREGPHPIRFAIVGRPIAGKSTLINRLIGEDRLLTGPEAGITRDSINVDWEWDGRRVRLVDTAGLRRKAKVQEKLEKLSTQDTIRALTFAEIVLLVMDATRPFEIQDLQIADLVEREGRALVYVLAKWDLIEDPQAALKAFIAEA